MRAPLVLVVAAVVKENPKVPDIEQIVAAGAAAQNMLVAAHALGLGGFWRTGATAYDGIYLALAGQEGAVLLTALYLSRTVSLTVAGLAAIGILAPSIASGDTSGQMIPALLIAAALLAMSAAVHEVVGRIRRDASATERKALELEAREERFRITVETAQVGLAPSCGAIGVWPAYADLAVLWMSGEQMLRT